VLLGGLGGAVTGVDQPFHRPDTPDLSGGVAPLTPGVRLKGLAGSFPNRFGRQSERVSIAEVTKLAALKVREGSAR
jgi:hypothetical protein